MQYPFASSDYLAERYHLPTCGMFSAEPRRFRLVFSWNASVTPLTREQLAKLNCCVVDKKASPFGAYAFRLGNLRAEKVAPQIGGSGWARWPGADHWLVTRDGREVFRTQSYTFVLRYFARAAGII